MTDDKQPPATVARRRRPPAPPTSPPLPGQRPPNAWHQRALREDAAAARRLRAQALITVTLGLSTPTKVIQAASRRDSQALLRIQLSQLLVSQPKWGKARATQVLARLQTIVGDERQHDRLTIAWLLDPRCGGRRYLAWLEVTGSFATALPPEGFPFTGLGESWPEPRSAVVGGRNASWAQLERKSGRFSTGHRADPYFDEFFGEGGRLAWTSGHGARRSRQNGHSDRPTWAVPETLLMDPGDAAAILRSPGSRWPELLAMLAVLHAWGTVTGEQMAAFTGVPSLATAAHPLVRAAFAAGLVDLALTHDSPSRSLLSKDVVYRGGRTKSFDEIIAPELTATERMAVLGSQEWRRPDWYDRHNVIAAELALRIAEHVDALAVLGPSFSTIDHLYAGTHSTWTQQPTKAGDLTVITPTGLRVVLEVTATINKELSAKVDAWLDELRSRRFEGSGVCVLFLDACGSGTNRPGALRRRIQRRMAQDKTMPDVAKRIGVVEWSDWFPARGQVASSFFSLSCRTPPRDGGDQWKVVRWLNGRLPRHDWPSMAIASSAAIMLQTPAVQRQRLTPPNPRALLLGALDNPRIPDPPARRLERSKAHPLGAAKGAAGPTGVPARLGWTADEPRLRRDRSIPPIEVAIDDTTDSVPSPQMMGSPSPPYVARRRRPVDDPS